MGWRVLYNDFDIDGFVFDGGIFVRSRFKRWIAILPVMLALLAATAFAEASISTTVILRVSRMTQNAVVEEGEDLSMEVSIDGVAPVSYQWYCGDVPISGATQKVYSIVNAQIEDTGVYRMDAFNEQGDMVVSMDISVRVIDDSVPKSGDDSLPLNVVCMGMITAAGVLAMTLRRKEAA